MKTQMPTVTGWRCCTLFGWVTEGGPGYLSESKNPPKTQPTISFKLRQFQKNRSFWSSKHSIRLENRTRILFQGCMRFFSVSSAPCIQPPGSTLTPRRIAHLYRSTPDWRPKIFYLVYIFLRNSWWSALKWEEKSWPKAHTPAAESQPQSRGRVSLGKDGCSWAKAAAHETHWREQIVKDKKRLIQERPRQKSRKMRSPHFLPQVKPFQLLNKTDKKPHLPGHFSEVSVLIYKSERYYKMMNSEFLWWGNCGTSFTPPFLHIRHGKRRRGAEETSLTRGLVLQ